MEYNLILDFVEENSIEEDYSECGSALIKSPQPGAAYSLTLTGEAASALTLSTAEQDVEVFSPALTAQED